MIDPEEKIVKLDELKPNRIIHESLSEDAVKRLRMIYNHVGYLLSPTFEQFEIDFLRDVNPEREVNLWLGMSVCFVQYFKGKTPTEEDRKEVLGLLVQMSMGVSPDDPRAKELQLVWERLRTRSRKDEKLIS